MQKVIIRDLSSTVSWFREDGRHFQILSQALFLMYGFYTLGWDADIWKVAGAFTGTLLVQSAAIHFGIAPRHSVKSALITSLGLSLLLRANSPWIFLFAGILAIGQKFAFRIQGKHIWNPANFGIVVVIFLSGNAWISPGQWGSGALLVFIIGTLGLAVLSRVHRLETALSFLLVFGLLEFSRSVLYMGWGTDVWLHKMGSGSLWLFALFMITDPMTIPNTSRMRIIWSALVALGSFVLANFYFVYAAPFWMLFFMTPLTPVFDRIDRGIVFSWLPDRKTPKQVQQTHTPLIR